MAGVGVAPDDDKHLLAVGHQVLDQAAARSEVDGVGGQSVFDELLQFLGRGRVAVPEGNGGTDFLAERSVGQADDRRLQHARMLVEDLLDLPGVDVEPAPDNQVLLAVDDVVVAVLVHGGEVPGPEPAVDQGGRRLGGLVPVALHDIVAVDGDLTWLARRHVAPFVVDQPELDACDRGADGTGLALSSGVVKRGDR